jgi:hypothetical protein
MRRAEANDHGSLGRRITTSSAPPRTPRTATDTSLGFAPAATGFRGRAVAVISTSIPGATFSSNRPSGSVRFGAPAYRWVVTATRHESTGAPPGPMTRPRIVGIGDEAAGEPPQPGGLGDHDVVEGGVLGHGMIRAARPLWI